MRISEAKSFNQKEFDAVRQLLLQLVGEEQLPSKEHYIKLIKSQNSQLFISKLENIQTGDSQIVGTITIATYDIPSGKRMWIEDVVVDSAVHGKGIGQKLIEFAIEHCKEMGGTDIRLTSRPARVAANMLYQKAGFEEVETNVYLLKLWESSGNTFKY